MQSEPTRVSLLRLHVARYRSLKDTTFEPNADLSVLVGPNGVGKTNLLQAILLLRGSPRRSFLADEERQFSARVSLQSEYCVGSERVTYSMDLNASQGERGLEDITSARESWSGANADGSRWKLELPLGFIQFALDPAEAGLLYTFRTQGSPRRARELRDQPDREHLEKIRPIVSFNRSLRYYAASQFTDPSRCPSSFEVEGDNELVDEYSYRGPHRNFVYSLFSLLKKDPAAYESFLDVVGPAGIGLAKEIRWKTFPLSSSEVKLREGGSVVRKRRKRTLVIPLIRTRHSSAVAFNQLSEGTFRSLALVFYLMNDDSSMLLLEEPEVCVHHGLLSSIVELIKARATTRQIVISTHSELVLDLVNEDQVFPVNLTAAGTTVSRLDKALGKREIKALRDYLRNSGNLGEYWKHGGLPA